MTESWKEANARMACLGCGESNADPYVMPNGVKTRVCWKCAPEWGVKLTPRELLPCEVQP